MQTNLGLYNKDFIFVTHKQVKFQLYFTAIEHKTLKQSLDTLTAFPNATSNMQPANQTSHNKQTISPNYYASSIGNRTYHTSYFKESSMSIY